MPCSCPRHNPAARVAVTQRTASDPPLYFPVSIHGFSYSRLISCLERSLNFIDGTNDRIHRLENTRKVLQAGVQSIDRQVEQLYGELTVLQDANKMSKAKASFHRENMELMMEMLACMMEHNCIFLVDAELSAGVQRLLRVLEGAIGNLKKGEENGRARLLRGYARGSRYGAGDRDHGLITATSTIDNSAAAQEHSAEEEHAIAFQSRSAASPPELTGDTPSENPATTVGYATPSAAAEVSTGALAPVERTPDGNALEQTLEASDSLEIGLSQDNNLFTNGNVGESSQTSQYAVLAGVNDTRSELRAVGSLRGRWNTFRRRIL
ncbi:hypothetical protein RUND412_004343 [Rhizina undulata]